MKLKRIKQSSSLIMNIITKFKVEYVKRVVGLYAKKVFN